MKVHQLEFCFERRGGKRKGAGRKSCSATPRMTHAKRESMSRHEPLHVTLRIRSGTRSLRCGREFAVIRRAFREARNRNGMRLVHYSVNHDHMHLIIEAQDRDSVARGINGLKVRLARQLNKIWGTSGPLFPDRYHDEVIRSPKQARNVVRYVLHNARKHGVPLSFSIDPCSSAAAFDGWAAPSIAPRPLESVVRPKTWLLTTGWKRHGLIGLEDVPKAKPLPKRRQR